MIIVGGKTFVAVCVAYTLFSLLMVVMTAHDYQKHSRGRLRGVAPGHEDVALQDHRKAVDAFIWSLGVTVICVAALVEYAAWTTGVRKYGTLFWVHETSDTIVVITLTLMRMRWTGVRDPRKHRALARFVLAPSIVTTFITGGVLLYRL